MYESEDVQVLAIIGSPRRNGNTEMLVDAILAGAAETGAQIGKVVLDELEIAPCRACDMCRSTGNCVHDDDMESILEMMESSQVWILGSPIYWWGPTAQMKTFIDRWYGAKHAKFQDKRVILAVPLGGSNDALAQNTIGMFRNIIDYLGMKHVATIVAPGVHQRGVIRDNKHILNEAHQIGVEVVEAFDVERILPLKSKDQTGLLSG